jgi:uncharacterized protein (TIGR02453 family)
MPAAAAVSFKGFPPHSVDFLRALALHQSRDWFQAHKDTFVSTLQQPMGAWVDQVSAELKRKEVPLHGDGVKAMFRMNRDVRFSKDKSPYKTHLGAVLSRDGTRTSGAGLLYLHVGPKECFAAAGVYMPEPPDLLRIRKRIVARPAAFRALVSRLRKARLALDPDGSLKRLPRGFEGVAGADLQAWVKLKSFIVMKPFPEAALTSGPRLVKTAVELAEDALPLLTFSWDALSGRS